MSATLELVLDASGMQRGAQQATKALDDVSAKAVVATTNVANAGKSLSSAFQATGGTVQIAQGITQTAQAFGQLNSVSGAFSASRTILEIGKTVQDFRELRSAVGATGGVFTVLGGILRAHPLMAIASVISLAASAMSLFGSNTKEATQSLNDYAGAVSNALGKAPELNIRAGYGLGDPRTSARGTADILTQLRLSDSGRTFTAGEASGLFGTSEDDLRRSMGEVGLELKSAGSMFPSYPIGTPRSRQFARSSFSRDQIVYAGEQILGRRSRPEMDTSGLYQFGASGSAYDPFAGITPSGPSNYVAQSAEDQARVQEENRRRQEESAQRIADIFGGIGQDIGSVAADLAMGAVTFRQAITSIAQNLFRQGLSSGLGSIFSAAAGSFGATGAQAAQNRVGGG